MSKAMTVRLPDETVQRIGELALDDHVSPTSYLKHLIKEVVDDDWHLRMAKMTNEA